ncbi:hypothetical protein JZ751_010924 [Albula glossodonta]|uniref:Translocase of outer mitochondrial membrane 20 n=1 Tax=Albula glossodonta TaxID=121402 RepID=A0A8T2NV87_9TELE|nr:hypothetical protein JZ751_010924 [Albula glossodonta]
MMGSRTSTIAAGVCGALFIGYCIYFDRKRRSDPNFKKRLREPLLDTVGFQESCGEKDGQDTDSSKRGEKEREKKAEGCKGKIWAGQGISGLASWFPLPDLKDAEAVQKFFLEEIQLGEELLAQGEYEKGVDHLTNAIAVCGQPQQLLQVLQQTLPPPVFQMLLTKLPTISQCRMQQFCCPVGLIGRGSREGVWGGLSVRRVWLKMTLNKRTGQATGPTGPSPSTTPILQQPTPLDLRHLRPTRHFLL